MRKQASALSRSIASTAPPGGSGISSGRRPIGRRSDRLLRPGSCCAVAEGHSRLGAHDRARARSPVGRCTARAPCGSRALALRDDDQLALGMGLVAEAADRALGQGEAVARDHEAADRGRTCSPFVPPDLDHGDRRPAPRPAWRSGYRVVEKERAKPAARHSASRSGAVSAPGGLSAWSDAQGAECRVGCEGGDRVRRVR